MCFTTDTGFRLTAWVEGQVAQLFFPLSEQALISMNLNSVIPQWYMFNNYLSEQAPNIMIPL